MKDSQILNDIVSQIDKILEIQSQIASHQAELIKEVFHLKRRQSMTICGAIGNLIANKIISSK